MSASRYKNSQFFFFNKSAFPGFMETNITLVLTSICDNRPRVRRGPKRPHLRCAQAQYARTGSNILAGPF